MEWQGETLKAIAFTPTGELRPQEVFSQVSGSEPETFQNLRGQAPGMSVATGRWEDYQLAVTIQPGRVEAALASAEVVSDQPGSREGLVDLNDPIQLIRTAAISLAAFPVTRVAAQVQLIRWIESVEGAPAELNRLLGQEVFPLGSLDGLYRINRPKAGFKSLTDVRFNRICTWGAAVRQAITVTINSSGAPITQASEGRAAVYLHLDFNNAPVEYTLDSRIASGITNEIWDEAERVAHDGREALD